MKLSIALFKQKKYKIITSVAFVLFLLSLTLYILTGDARNFQRLTKNFFVSELSSNTLNMHYTIANPISYDIKDYKAVLPFYSQEERNKSLLEVDATLASLKNINSRHLSSADRYTYALLSSYLKTQKEGMAFAYYSNPVSPSSGIQSQLPILLAEYQFRSKRDIVDYLSLLEQLGGYFDGAILYLNDQASSSLFMPDYSVDKVITQCDNIMEEASILNGSHFLHSTFQERLHEALTNKFITENEMDQFIAENNRLLSTVVRPAYERLGDCLSALKGKGTNANGLAHYPKGKEYYRYLIKSNVATYRDIEDIKLLLFDDFNANYETLLALVKEVPTLTNLSQDAPFPYEDATAMLKNLQTMMAHDYPPLTKVTQGTLPVCTVKSISPSLENYCSPAFYLTPPLDDVTQNVIYINRKDDPYGIDLYTTLAHEGYPGHLYQTVYNQLYAQKQNANPVRSLLNYGGYVEGWALYVELSSYDYAKKAMAEIDSSTNALYESYRLNRKLQLCVYSLLDIAIHYEGATYPQVHKMLATIGITNATVTKAIYEYIVEEPTTYMKYYLGYLEIIELKKQAKDSWKDTYSDYDFHQFFLESGPSDFSNLGKLLQQTK